MARITRQRVDHYLNILNLHTKKQYSLYVHGEPTKYQLVYKNEHGGMTEISRDGLTLTEVYEAIYAMTNLLFKEQEK